MSRVLYPLQVRRVSSAEESMLGASLRMKAGDAMHLPTQPYLAWPRDYRDFRVILGIDFGIGMKSESSASLRLYRQPHGQKCQDCELRNASKTYAL